MSPDRVLTPIPLGDSAIGTAQVRGGRFNPFGSGPLDMIVLSEANGWEPEPSLRMPAATSRLFPGGEDVLSINTSEIAITSKLAVLEAAGEVEVTEEEDDPSDQDWLSKLTNMMGGATSGFSSVLPPQMAISPPRDVAVDSGGQWIIAISRGRIVRLERPASNALSEPWELSSERVLEGEASSRSQIAVSGNRLMVARSEEPLVILDAESLEPIVEDLPLPESLVPVSAVGVGDRGRFALVTSDGRGRILSPGEDAAAKSSAYVVSKKLSTREVELVYFHAEENELYLAHHIDRLDILDADDLSLQRTIRPELARWRLVDRYVIGPLRIIIPQTGELGETIAAMVSGKTAISFNNPAGEEELVRYHIFRPVLSCTLFIFVMLTIGCVYFATRDF